MSPCGLFLLPGVRPLYGYLLFESSFACGWTAGSSPLHFIHLGIYVCLLVVVCSTCLWKPEEGITPPETRVSNVINDPEVLGTKYGSSLRAVCAVNNWAIFLAPRLQF